MDAVLQNACKARALSPANNASAALRTARALLLHSSAPTVLTRDHVGAAARRAHARRGEHPLRVPRVPAGGRDAARGGAARARHAAPVPDARPHLRGDGAAAQGAQAVHDGGAPLGPPRRATMAAARLALHQARRAAAGELLSGEAHGAAAQRPRRAVRPRAPARAPGPVQAGRRRPGQPARAAADRRRHRAAAGAVPLPAVAAREGGQ